MRLCGVSLCKQSRRPLARLTLSLGLAMLLAAPTGALAQQTKQAQPHVHGPDCGHNHTPAPPRPKLTPEQEAERQRQLAVAYKKARVQFAAMKLDPKLAAREVAFHDGRQLYTFDMPLSKVITAVLADGNQCSVTAGKDAGADHLLEVKTKDGKRLVFFLNEKDQEIRIMSMTLSRPTGPALMKLEAGRAAFYLISFMAK